MRYAIYARVSTVEQKTDMQLTDLRNYVARMPQPGDSCVEYLETESSVKRRPVFEKMMADARSRKFDVIIVWKIDRFARSMSQFIQKTLELDAAGVALRAITQNISTESKDPMGKFVLGLFQLLAEFERGMIVDRVVAGVHEYQRAMKAGQVGRQRHSKSGKDLPVGRPKKLFDRSRAAELRKQGMSWRMMSRELKTPVLTLRKALGATR